MSCWQWNISMYLILLKQYLFEFNQMKSQTKENSRYFFFVKFEHVSIDVYIQVEELILVLLHLFDIQHLKEKFQIREKLNQ